MEAYAKTGSYGPLSTGKVRTRLLRHHSGVDECRSHQVAPHRETRLDAALHHEISAEWTRLEVPILEIRRVGIAGGDVGAAETSEVGAVVGLQHADRNGEHTRPELILAEAAHRV